MTTAIIGSGFAGLAASHGLSQRGIQSVVYEKNGYWGGHTHTKNIDGFVVDEGPHVSFTKDERVKRVFLKGAKDVEELAARITNWYQGSWVEHPAQVHLHGLDPELVTNCIVDFVAERSREREVNHYGDWLMAMYGETFATNFPFRYTRKYWTVEPHELGTDWVGSRMYPPKLEEVVRGALSANVDGEFHYFNKYRYPTTGGYQSFMGELANGADVRLEYKVANIDVSNKSISFTNGETAGYDNLISTMPLDLLIPTITGTEIPAAVSAAVDDLLCTSVLLIDLGIARADLFDHDWFYIYDEDMPASRVHFPHHLSPKNAPAGHGCIQAEVYFSKRKPLADTAENICEKVIDDFMTMGIIRSRDEIVMRSLRTLEYANIVFDHKRQAALDVIVPFVESFDIHLAGRFGQWGYHWTDDATNAGWQAAADVAGVSVDEMLADV